MRCDSWAETRVGTSTRVRKPSRGLERQGTKWQRDRRPQTNAEETPLSDRHPHTQPAPQISGAEGTSQAAARVCLSVHHPVYRGATYARTHTHTPRDWCAGCQSSLPYLVSQCRPSLHLLSDKINWSDKSEVLNPNLRVQFKLNSFVSSLQSDTPFINLIVHYNVLSCMYFLWSLLTWLNSFHRNGVCHV